jgi:hypothetical protein
LNLHQEEYHLNRMQLGGNASGNTSLLVVYHKGFNLHV